jgi:hypothetical protein
VSKQTETGKQQSVDGWWTIEWDHTHNGYLTYTVTDEDEGNRYIARYDDGWRIAPEYMATVDMERLIGNEVQAFYPELEGLIQTLNLISGKQV